MKLLYFPTFYKHFNVFLSIPFSYGFFTSSHVTHRAIISCFPLLKPVVSLSGNNLGQVVRTRVSLSPSIDASSAGKVTVGQASQGSGVTDFSGLCTVWALGLNTGDEPTLLMGYRTLYL